MDTTLKEVLELVGKFMEQKIIELHLEKVLLIFVGFQLVRLQMKGRWESNRNVWFPEIKLLNPKLNYNVLSPNSYTHISVRDLQYISKTGLPILLQEKCGLILGIYKSITDTWMWKLRLRPRNSHFFSLLLMFVKLVFLKTFFKWHS